MARLVLLPLLAGAALVGSLGCSGGAAATGPATFEAEPLLSLPSTSGTLTIEVRTSPAQPPDRGINAVEYRITESGGAPAEGLSLQVVPWMPAMGHGTSVVPSVAAEGDGRYVISDVYFFMAGEWTLRTTIGGASTDGVVPTFEVP